MQENENLRNVKDLRNLKENDLRNLQENEDLRNLKENDLRNLQENEDLRNLKENEHNTGLACLSVCGMCV